MQSIDLSEMEKLNENINGILKDMPEERRKLHEELAQGAKEEVDAQINASVGGDSGMVAGWQETHVGSGGGYAAVRATDAATGNDSPGAITNYLENGHKIRQPSGHAEHYKPKIKESYVEVKHFYESTKASMESRAISIAEGFADKIAERLEHG